MHFLTNPLSCVHFAAPPLVVPISFGEEVVNWGDMVSVTCTVPKGDFPIDISWLLNNKSVDSNSVMSILRTNKRISQLSIESVQAEHSGQYSCFAQNRAGTALQSTVLNVNGTFSVSAMR